jgi:hypothetical protein
MVWHPSDCRVAFSIDKSSEKAREMGDRFNPTMIAFCNELTATFPELGPAVAASADATATSFWAAWVGDVDILAGRDATLLQSRRAGNLFGSVVITPSLWAEVSDSTQKAIWRYLRTLLLESYMDLSLETDDATTRLVMRILLEERFEGKGAADASGGAGVFDNITETLKPLLDRLRGLLRSAAGTDASGGAAAAAGGAAGAGAGFPDIPMPEIPERLRKGRIARMAEEMAKQFNPADFGIDPALLQGSMEDVLKTLAEIYQRDPTILITGAKRVADKIKRQILGGSLNRDELIAEAREFVELFKEHPLFKEAIAKFQGMVGEGGLAEMFGAVAGGGSGAPSERLRAVRERLQKKQAEKEASKKQGPK